MVTRGRWANLDGEIPPWYTPLIADGTQMLEAAVGQSCRSCTSCSLYVCLSSDCKNRDARSMQAHAVQKQGMSSKPVLRVRRKAFANSLQPTSLHGPFNCMPCRNRSLRLGRVILAVPHSGHAACASRREFLLVEPDSHGG